MIFTIFKSVHKNQQILFIINNFNFLRESNSKIWKQLIFYIVIFTFQETINAKVIKYNYVFIAKITLNYINKIQDSILYLAYSIIYSAFRVVYIIFP